jgi:glycosyltransferase involved in cell wall biosynthesis
MENKAPLSEKSLLFFGPAPPPLGGVSVHIQRLATLAAPRFKAVGVLASSSSSVRELDAQGRVITEGKGLHNLLLTGRKILARFAPDIVHIHISTGFKLSVLWTLYKLALRKKPKVVLTIHTGAFVEFYQRSNAVKLMLTRKMVENADAIICVNPAIEAFLKDRVKPGTILTTIPAFLPSPANPSDQDRQSIADLRKSAEKIIVISGYCMDYYGFHLLLDSIERLGLKQKVGLAFIFYSQYDPAYEKALMDKAANGFQLKCFKDMAPDRFNGLLSLCDIYYRATDRDGDCVALREAGALNLQIVATNVVNRPAGTATFGREDPQDTDRVLRSAIDNPKVGLLGQGDNDFRAKILDVYATIG